MGWPPRTGLPTTLRATLWLADAAGGGFDAVLGTDFIAWRQPVMVAADGSLPIPWRWGQSDTYGDCNRVYRANVMADVRLHDDDGDGLADRLDGSGSGGLQVIISDVGEDIAAMTVAFTGRVEHEPPSLRWSRTITPGAFAVVGREAPLLVASEPVTIPADAWLEAPDGSRVALRAQSSSEGIAAGWSVWPSVRMPLATTLTLRFDGDARDMDGHLLPLPPPLPTLPIPSAVATEGLEAGTSAHVQGSTGIRGSIGSLPAISGSSSALVVAPDYGAIFGGLLIARVQVPSDATVIRFRARYVTEYVRLSPAGAARCTSA